ncbi:MULTISPECIES: aldo/keto reductase [Rhizobium/Agrobacterium group]|uniref:aldo/keto reductase n=1 Tax=Rhizobium/Agrobacterium group TaxID=227290 RepID=UPI000B3FF7E2|nr:MULTISPECIES: aldo/keto reductase [Rhizobium/Agrobacterium group]MCF1485582.1 aldo/keto reductase [Allorhizobium ampelinum]NSZ46273.1 aldo/keto reductase [Agrobacterium vitis]NTA25369.1 aldo/keto reductase [Allorhizobium ampelinum]OVE97159.1 hypothetical protein B7W85_02515 [Allorhizobium ampelinum]
MNDRTLPSIGLGTWKLRGENCQTVVRNALDKGYRHFDTSSNYGNELDLGLALRNFDRSKLILTSKVEPAPAEDIVHALEQSLRDLSVDYLDFLLLHYPNHKSGMVEIFEVFEVLKTTGKIRNWGVSNFTEAHLKDCLRDGFAPAVNQVEFHPYLFQIDLLRACELAGIQVVSYRPFGKGTLVSDPIIRQIAAQYMLTPGQLILNWIVLKGACAIPKATSDAHLIENINALSVNLEPDDVVKIDSLHRNQRFCELSCHEFDYTG